MRTSRLSGLIITAILVMGLATASTAIAVPEFKPSTKGTSVTVTADGVTEVNSAGSGAHIVCQKSSTTGEISSATLVGNLHIHFLECEASTNGGTKCPVMSVGAPLENLIITTTLHGLLGLILPKPTGTGSAVGLVLLPSSGKRWFTLLPSSAGCIVATIVTGSIAGLVEPVGTSSKTGKLTFSATSAGKQEITDVALSSGGTIEPEFGFGTATVTVTANQLVAFGVAVEVT
jgi:hypothetical protein